MKTLNIALIQERSIPFDQTENIKNGLHYLEQAKAIGADLVLFPECWITSYQFPNIDPHMPFEQLLETPAYNNWFSASLDDDGPQIQAFQNKARELSIGVVITGFSKGQYKPYNSAYIIDRNGEILLKYNKVHTCDFSSEALIESGSKFPVTTFDGIQIGVMICYDREYPESARSLMLEGAEIILVPNDCTAMLPRVQVISTRAYENMVGIAMANPPGLYAGLSCAFSPIVWDENGVPIDNTIYLANDLDTGLFLATFDVDTLRDYRRSEMIGNTFRKPKTYHKLIETTIKPPFIRKYQNK